MRRRVAIADMINLSLNPIQWKSWLPPLAISAPFKILLFILADGWHLIILALGGSFG